MGQDLAKISRANRRVYVASGFLTTPRAHGVAPKAPEALDTVRAQASVELIWSSSTWLSAVEMARPMVRSRLRLPGYVEMNMGSKKEKACPALYRENRFKFTMYYASVVCIVCRNAWRGASTRPRRYN
ncbi:unnamed protein product, partial [Iphiclides podalirius]